MTSRRPWWRSKQRNGGHLRGVKYSFGDLTVLSWSHERTHSIPLLAHDVTTRFAGVSGEFSESSACSTIEEEMEGLKAAQCKNDLLEFFRENSHEYKQGNPTPIVKGAYESVLNFG